MNLQEIKGFVQRFVNEKKKKSLPKKKKRFVNEIEDKFFHKNLFLIIFSQQIASQIQNPKIVQNAQRRQRDN